MRAIGIVRVSRRAGREGQSFASPLEQRERIESTCARDGMELVALHEEIDVSGGTALASRKGLSAAVEAIEAAEADVLVVAYFDRLVRSLRVQEEVVSRVEAAGARVLALDFGEVSGASAAQWLSGTMIGAVAEYHRRAIAERSGEAQALAVARGVAPWPRVAPGYDRGADGRLVASDQAAAVREAFRARAAGASISALRWQLRAGGVELSYSAVQRMLGSHVYLGQIRFGKLVNENAHEAIVAPDLWQAVQRVRIPRGPQPRSERLLARLGVLLCGSCGGRMGASTSHNGRYPIYRCPASTSKDCDGRASVRAETVEGLVVKRVREALRDVEGRASADAEARQAAEAAEGTQADLDAAIRAFAGLSEEPAAVERLSELRQRRDDASERAHRLGSLRSSVVLRADADWERLSLAAKREIIRAVVERVTVAPGRGEGRIAIELVSE